jgi:hypothetical protein
MPESETVNQTRYNGNYAVPTPTPKSAMALFDDFLSTSYFPTDEISPYSTQIARDNTVREYAGYAFPMHPNSDVGYDFVDPFFLSVDSQAIVLPAEPHAGIVNTFV